MERYANFKKQLHVSTDFLMVKNIQVSGKKNYEIITYSTHNSDHSSVAKIIQKEITIRGIFSESLLMRRKTSQNHIESEQCGINEFAKIRRNVVHYSKMFCHNEVITFLLLNIFQWAFQSNSIPIKVYEI